MVLILIKEIGIQKLKGDASTSMLFIDQVFDEKSLRGEDGIGIFINKCQG